MNTILIPSDIYVDISMFLNTKKFVNLSLLSKEIHEKLNNDSVYLLKFNKNKNIRNIVKEIYNLNMEISYFKKITVREFARYITNENFFEDRIGFHNFLRTYHNYIDKNIKIENKFPLDYVLFNPQILGCELAFADTLVYFGFNKT